MLSLLKPRQAQTHSIIKIASQPWQARIFFRGFSLKQVFGEPAHKIPKINSPLDSFPTQAEEFDAHKYKMEVKYDNKHETLWYNKERARNIFRYDTQFPDVENDERNLYRDHDSTLFAKSEWKKRNEHELRRIDIMRLIRLKEKLRKKNNMIKGQKVSVKQAREIYHKGKIDPEFNVITGYGHEEFLKLIRHKTDLKRNVNNQMMDQLVEKLGFLDYRDFLAVNKYIIESKRAEEYHVFARGQILSEAMKRFTKQKLDEINQNVEEKVKESKGKEEVTDDIRDLKLKAIMDENPELEKEYREEYLKYKKSQESFRARYEDLHSKFDKVIAEINKNGVRREGEDLVPEEPYSTEYSDQEMYSQKMTRWYKTSKEMRDWYKDQIEDANSKAKEKEIEKEYKNE